MSPILARPRTAALAAGAVAVIGFAPAGVWPLAILAPALLVFLWRNARPRAAAASGFAFGLGLFGAGVSWIYVSLHHYGMMAAPLAALATVAFCAVLALFPAAAGAVFAALRPGQASAPALFAALWTLTEWLRGWILTGFPWLSLGYSQSDSPLAGYAPVAGVYSVSFAVVLAAGLVPSLFERSARARLGALATLVFLFAGGALLRAIDWTAPAAAPLAVSLVQGNIPQDIKFEASRYATTLAAYRRLVERSRGRLIVLPETAIPRFLDSIEPDYLRALDAIARARGGDLLLGVPIRSADGRYFNSVVSLGVSPPQRYDKSHLVPFGEFTPPGFALLARTVSIPLADFSPGSEHPRPLAVAGERVAIDICYEDAFGAEIIRPLPAASLLVNVSNDAWFGDSLAPEQHLQISRLRAIETGRYMLRATNSGVTAIVDPHGRVIARLPKFAEGVLEGEVRGYTGATFYVRAGNAPIVLVCFAIVLAAALAAPARIGRASESR